MKKLLLLFLLFNGTLSFAAPADTRPRTIVTTDGEIDDVDSFIRMLLYANEFKLEGLIYSSSMWHFKGDGKGTTMVSEMEMTRKLYGAVTDLRWPGERWIQDLIDAYEVVYPRLVTHAEGYPTPAYLRSIIRVGNITFEGEMDEITAGSTFIEEKLLDDDPSPIYLQVWGGTNTIARSLKSIEEKYQDSPEWPAIKRKVSQKAVLLTIMDQDATYQKYIAPHWPDVRILYNTQQFWGLAYNWQNALPSAFLPFLEGTFMGPHIINNHGPLTKLYYSYGDGQQQPGDPGHIHGDPAQLKDAQWGSFQPYDFISEGDSPAYLHLIDVGLDNLEHPDYGGWGGRLVQNPALPNRWEDSPAAASDFNPYTNELDALYAQTRWIPALQRDFAARADWCVLSYAEANHPPAVTLRGKANLTVTPGQRVKLKARATDPDGQALQYHWWQYHEADSYPGLVSLAENTGPKLRLTVPADLKPGQTIHLVLEVTDTHAHPTTRYQRVILQGK